MLITDSFVMLNYPKTGSTFARKVIKELYASEPRRWFRRRFCKELILPNIRHAGPPDQHGCYAQIPRRYRNREVMSIVRNPFDRFLSAFQFRYWAVNPLMPLTQIQERYPNFPELSLDQYVDYVRWENEGPVGPQTLQFLQLFSVEPPLPISRRSNLKSVLPKLAPVTFLRQETLNDDLIRFLSRKGFKAERTAFIRSHECMNVTEKQCGDRDSLWTPKALEYVRSAESLLFEILGAKDIHFAPPRQLVA